MKSKNELMKSPEVVMFTIGEVYARVCQRATGYEVLFAFDEDMFFIAKDKELIIGNHEMIVKCGAKGLDPKTCGVIKDFGLTYNKFHEMELVPTTYKDAVYRAGDWLGLPL